MSLGLNSPSFRSHGSLRLKPVHEADAVLVQTGVTEGLKTFTIIIRLQKLKV